MSKLKIISLMRTDINIHNTHTNPYVIHTVLFSWKLFLHIREIVNAHKCVCAYILSYLLVIIYNKKCIFLLDHFGVSLKFMFRSCLPFVFREFMYFYRYIICCVYI